LTEELLFGVTQEFQGSAVYCADNAIGVGHDDRIEHAFKDACKILITGQKLFSGWGPFPNTLSGPPCSFVHPLLS
jgi:hypothetical protein